MAACRYGVAILVINSISLSLVRDENWECIHVNAPMPGKSWLAYVLRVIGWKGGARQFWTYHWRGKAKPQWSHISFDTPIENGDVFWTQHVFFLKISQSWWTLWLLFQVYVYDLNVNKYEPLSEQSGRFNTWRWTTTLWFIMRTNQKTWLWSILNSS